MRAFFLALRASHSAGEEFFERHDLQGLGGHLFARLDRVAPIDEQRGLVAQHDGKTGAAR